MSLGDECNWRMLRNGQVMTMLDGEPLMWCSKEIAQPMADWWNADYRRRGLPDEFEPVLVR